MKTTRMLGALMLAAGAILIACSEKREVPGRTGAAGGPDSISAAQRSPAGTNVDHSTMPMPNDAAAPGAGSASAGSADMPGMDHSTMSMPAPGVAGRTTPAREGGTAAPRAGNSSGTVGMGAMDHSGMDMSPSGSQTRLPTATTGGTAPGMSRMPGMSGTAGMNHEGMDMSRATPMPAVDPALEKLQQMVQILTRDPLVRQRIQSDTALRNRWTDPDVRKIVLGTR